MEPVQGDSAGAQPPQTQKSLYETQAPFQRTTPKHHVFTDIPSIKYKSIEEALGYGVAKQAFSPPSPVLPRRQTPKTWNATMKERNPLASSLTGPGRAGKFGELAGESGGQYQGEVLAGRPHGHGYYHIFKGPGQFELQYEGEWVQGRREGLGTRYYHNNESYSGQFVANIRHGFGRYFFSNGDVYAGEWVDDRRTGRGTYYHANGDIFVGDFVRDKQEGMGALFMMQRQRKYVAEYVNGAPTCGTMLEIDNADLEPLQGHLLSLALHKKLENATNCAPTLSLPEIALAQPNKLLGEQFIAVRKLRANSNHKEIREMQTTSGSLSDKEVDMLRHSFSLMAGGDNVQCSLHPQQLRELCVMAGLDPAAPATHSLVESMLARKDPETGRISFDAFMQVACHYQVKADPAPEFGSVVEGIPEGDMFGTGHELHGSMFSTGHQYMEDEGLEEGGGEQEGEGSKEGEGQQYELTEQLNLTSIQEGGEEQGEEGGAQNASS